MTEKQRKSRLRTEEEQTSNRGRADFRLTEQPEDRGKVRYQTERTAKDISNQVSGKQKDIATINTHTHTHTRTHTHAHAHTEKNKCDDAFCPVLSQFAGGYG